MPQFVLSPAELLDTLRAGASTATACAQLPPWVSTGAARLVAGSLAWTLLPLHSVLLVFLGRLFSRNTLKICNYHTRAERETCRLPVPSGQASLHELRVFVGSSSSCLVLGGKEWSSRSRRGCWSAGAAIGEMQPPRSRAVSVSAQPLISPIALETLPSR